MTVSGLVAGGLLGYFRFGDRIGYGVVLGLGIALIVGRMTWSTVRDPARFAVLTPGSTRSGGKLRGARLRLSLPFAALGVAAVAGAFTDSAGVFAITLAAGLAASFVLRRFLPR